MSRYLYLLVISVFSIASFSFNSSDLYYKNHSLNISPPTTPTPVQSEESNEIELDKKVVCNPCPPGYRCLRDPDCSDKNSDMRIAVFAVKPKGDRLNYEYTVSGGRVIGEGAKVFWDLTGAQPGTYQIKVIVEDKSTGKKQTETETITVKNFTDGADCTCPTLSVDPPKLTVGAGETVTFIANVNGGSADDITYKWKISTGEIIEGQGTPIIKVATNSKMTGKTIEATIEIEGVCEVCPKSESASVLIAKKKTGKKKD